VFWRVLFVERLGVTPTVPASGTIGFFGGLGITREVPATQVVGPTNQSTYRRQIRARIYNNSARGQAIIT
jgi:hypothetical protein